MCTVHCGIFSSLTATWYIQEIGVIKKCKKDVHKRQFKICTLQFQAILITYFKILQILQMISDFLKFRNLKYGFCNKPFRKDEPLTSWTLLQHICPHFCAWLLLYPAITPKSEDKYVVKVINWSEVHLSEMTCWKIHALVL